MADRTELRKLAKAATHDANLLVAAVNALPGLLDALDEAEAKARRAHQIIGNITVRLNDTVVAELNTHWQGRLADAWDEGRAAGADMGLAIGERVLGIKTGYPEVPTNPYRHTKHGPKDADSAQP